MDRLFELDADALTPQADATPIDTWDGGNGFVFADASGASLYRTNQHFEHAAIAFFTDSRMHVAAPPWDESATCGALFIVGAPLSDFAPFHVSSVPREVVNNEGGRFHFGHNGSTDQTFVFDNATGDGATGDAGVSAGEYVVCDVQFDDVAWRAFVNGTEVALTPFLGRANTGKWFGHTHPLHIVQGGTIINMRAYAGARPMAKAERDAILTELATRYDFDVDLGAYTPPAPKVAPRLRFAQRDDGSRAGTFTRNHPTSRQASRRLGPRNTYR